MKRFLLLCLSLLPIGATGLLAQSECLPQNYSIIFGGGVSLPHVEGNRNDFFSKNGNRVGYDLMTEGRYYITPLFAAGLQYDYLRMARLPDKAHLHCTTVIVEIGKSNTTMTHWLKVASGNIGVST